MTTLARILSVMTAPAKYPGESVITVFCPYCGECHKHLGTGETVRTARCDPDKEYLPTKW